MPMPIPLPIAENPISERPRAGGRKVDPVPPDAPRPPDPDPDPQPPPPV